MFTISIYQIVHTIFMNDIVKNTTWFHSLHCCSLYRSSRERADEQWTRIWKEFRISQIEIKIQQKILEKKSKFGKHYQKMHLIEKVKKTLLVLKKSIMKIILQNKIKATSILNIEELKLSKFMTTKNLKKKVLKK